MCTHSIFCFNEPILSSVHTQFTIQCFQLHVMTDTIQNKGLSMQMVFFYIHIVNIIHDRTLKCRVETTYILPRKVFYCKSCCTTNCPLTLCAKQGGDVIRGQSNMVLSLVALVLGQTASRDQLYLVNTWIFQRMRDCWILQHRNHSLYRVQYLKTVFSICFTLFYPLFSSETIPISFHSTIWN